VTKEEFDAEKWKTEVQFREREIAVLAHEQSIKREELEIKRDQASQSQWRNPLVLAIVAAAIAALGNAVVAISNGILQRGLEDHKAEQARILEALKTGIDNPDKAATNLKFLIDAGLIADQDRIAKINDFLRDRPEGTGPSLAAATRALGIVEGVVGEDEAVSVARIPSGSKLGKAVAAVGQVQLINRGQISTCTAFLVSIDHVVTARFCADDARTGGFVIGEGKEKSTYDIHIPPVELGATTSGLEYALLRVNGDPGKKHGFLKLSTDVPVPHTQLDLILFRSTELKLIVPGSEDCRITAVEPKTFYHLCDTGYGASGAPLLLAPNYEVVGFHLRRSEHGKVAVRSDQLLSSSPLLKSLQAE